jgi:putative ABC transport system permease protein
MRTGRKMNGSHRRSGVLGVLSLLVSSSERGDWRQEWEGELAALDADGPASLWARAGVLSTATEDAMRLGIRRIQPGSWGQDVRFALRTLRTRPAYAWAALLTFALGIGANVAIFTVINAYVLRPFPIQEPYRVVWLDGIKEGRHSAVSAPDFVDWRDQSSSFQDLVAVHEWSTTLTEMDRPMRVTRAMVTPGLFRMIGVQPMLGRSFLDDEGVTGNDQVAILSYELWSGVYGSDPGVVGESMVLNGVRSTIVGVLPRGFLLPPFTSQVWVPLAFTQDALEHRGRHNLSVIGRLADDVDVDAAQAEMDVIGRGLASAYPQTNVGWGVHVRELHKVVVGSSSGSLWMLFGGVGLVLLIACVNVASLTVTRGAGRQQELAVRVALGASRGRILSQLLVESLLLALGGGALGVGVAYLALGPIEALVPASLAEVGVLSLDWRVLAFALTASAVTGLAAGALPALRLSTAAGSSGGVAQGLRTRSGQTHVRNGLVVAEYALAMILLVGAGLFVRSLNNLYSVDLGFDPERVTTFGLTFPEADYPAPVDVIAGMDGILARFRDQGGFEEVAATSHLPLSGARLSSSVRLDGDAGQMGTNSPSAAIKVVTPGYFELMGIPLVEGRYLTRDDDNAGELVVVINQNAAERYWPGERAIGRMISYTEDEDEAPVVRRVVGVIGDVRWAGPQREATAELYQSHLQTTAVWEWFGRSISFVMREGRAGSLTMPGAQTLVSDGDPNLPVVGLRSLEQVLDRSVAAPRFQGTLLGLFAGLALLLAAVGTYSVMAFSVRQRTREIGIRVAVGADRGDVMRGVIVSGARLALVGTAVGAVGALLLSRLVSSLLWGVGGADPLTYLAVAGLLGAVTLLACFVPAKRATHVDPVEALRTE